MLAKDAQGGLFFSAHRVNPEVRKQALRASRDAVLAYTLDPLNARAFHRRGQALLLLSSMQPRSKTAAKSFEVALKIGTLPERTKPETVQWLQYARKRTAQETELPICFREGCAVQ